MMFAMTREAVFRPARILVVDDHAANRALVEVLLKAAGTGEILQAPGGEEGLAMALEHRPDLLVLDLMMPGMDGFEVCRRLRADPTMDDMPILVQTALDGADERAQVFDMGASDLVVKPINAREFLARARVHLENRLLVRSLRDSQQRMTTELKAARAMQEAILPSPAVLAEIRATLGLSVEAVFEPSSEIGGDLWGVHRLGGGQLGLFTIDFSGHGVSAALNVFRLHALMADHPPDPNDPAGYLEHLNDLLVRVLPRGQFATMFYGVIDRQAETLVYAAAGAPDPLLDGVALDGSGLPLGILAGARHDNRHCAFGDGSTLFLYSDALTETPLSSGAPLGEEGLAAMLARADRSASPEVLLAEFRAAAPRELPDDLTAVVVRAAP